MSDIKAVFKESIKKVIASINPGTQDISDMGDGTIKGALRALNEKIQNLDAGTPNVYHGSSSSGYTEMNIRIRNPRKWGSVCLLLNYSNSVYIVFVSIGSLTTTASTNGITMTKIAGDGGATISSVLGAIYTSGDSSVFRIKPTANASSAFNILMMAPGAYVESHEWV